MAKRVVTFSRQKGVSSDVSNQIIFQEISHMTALEADERPFSITEELALSDITAMRRRLRLLASIMVRYTLSMSSNDCGGKDEF